MAKKKRELTVAEYAKQLDVSVRTVYNKINSGEIKTRKIGKITIVIVD